jgi:hypothetical protein
VAGVLTPGEANERDGHLSDDAVVVRGGMMNRRDLIGSARRYADQNNGVYGLSFWSWLGLSAGEITLRVKGMHAVGRNPVGHGQMRHATAGKLREPTPEGRSFGLLKTRQDGHYTLTFPSEPTEADWERLDNMFGPLEPNPAAD